MEKSDDELRFEANKEVMARIWSQIPKEPGTPVEMVRYLQNDLRYLYDFGFADTDAFTYEEWEKAFEDFKQPDGSYLFNKDQFVNKIGRYKYAGRIKKPLDVLKIREGWYEINTWREFLIRNILPSTTALNLEFLKEGEKKAKEKGLIVKGRIKIGKEVKLWLKQIIDANPSPLRRRELGVQESYEKMVNEAAARSGKSISQQSTFEVGKKLGDTQKKNLDETLMKRTKISAKASDVGSVSLKDLRKKGTTRPRKTTA